MPKIKGSPEKGTRSEGKQRVYAGEYSSNYLQAKGDVFADLPNPMGENPGLWSSSTNTGPANGYDKNMGYWSAAESAKDVRAGKASSLGKLQPVENWTFNDDTTPPHGAVSPDYHRAGGFSSDVRSVFEPSKIRPQAAEVTFSKQEFSIMAKNSYDTPADDQSLTTGQRSTGPGGGLSKGRNSDRNAYYPSASKRDQQGYKGPVGAEGVKGFAGQDGSIPSNEYGLDSKWNYLSDKNLTPKELLSGDFEAPTKAQRIAAQASGGITATPWDGSKYQGGEPADTTRKQTTQGTVKTTPEWLRRRSG